MKTNPTENAREDEIRAVFDSWHRAVLDHDVERIMTHYAPDIVAFDAVDSLQFKGHDGYRRQWAMGFDMLKGGQMVFDVSDLAITAADDVGFAHGLCRCGGVSKDGVEETGWMRFTACYRKRNGQWLVVHEHFSVPFDMQSAKPLFDLQP
ncbi:MAG: YybH family protein [Alphaproteobacteria bacterium]